MHPAMNGNRFTLNREPAQSVPILAPVASAYPGIGVLGIEFARVGDRSISGAVASAFEVLRPAVSSFANSRVALVGMTPPLRSYSRTGRLSMERQALWGQWESQGVALPHGERRDWQTGRTDVQFGGLLVTDLEQLGTAIEVSRARSAVCLVLPPPENIDRLERAARAIRDVSADGNTLVPQLVPSIPSGGLLIRGFGSFDDHVVGIDIYADTAELDSLQQALS